jgi:hypothetical protein
MIPPRAEAQGIDVVVRAGRALVRERALDIRRAVDLFRRHSERRGS